jgi:UDP-3-O-[3-hydroxymyristoyl] N-acetylglucosamine deacetylase
LIRIDKFTAMLNATSPAATEPHHAHASPARQHTLGAAVAASGIGVHTGEKVSFRLLPADANTGVVFVRTDLKNGARAIPARWDRVVDTQLCTVIGNGEGGLVATIEHLMAALRAAGIDNANVEIDGPEVPVMDGSSAAFVDLIEEAGVLEQTVHRHDIVVLKNVELLGKNKSARLEPAAAPLFSFDIAFDQKLIQKQHGDFTLTPSSFKKEISRARTFGFFEEVEQLQKMGFARGGSLDNAIVIKGDKVMNEGGLRYEDEFVRHKLLDAVGDLALAGAPVRAHFHGNCSGHSLNNQLLRALFADPEAWCLADADDRTERTTMG